MKRVFKYFYCFRNGILLSLFCIIHITQVFSQQLGVPPFNYYGTEEYGAAGRNYSIVSDSSGIIYVANPEGVLRFDGISWMKIKLPDQRTAYWLETDRHGNIYVASNGDFGVLKVNEQQQIYYHSFLPLIDEKYRDFSEVWEIAVRKDAVLFRSRKYVFKYAKGKITPITRPENKSFDLVITVNDTVYTRVRGAGLAQIYNEKIQTLPNSEFFASKKINDMFPHRSGKVMVATRYFGLFLYDRNEIIPIETPANQYFLKNYIYDGKYLSDGNYAIVTMTGGVLIINPEGEEVFRFDISNGLGNRQLLFVGEYSGQLWLGTKNGIFEIAYNSPFRKLGKETGIEGQVTSIYADGDEIYITCSDGAYQMIASEGKTEFVLASDFKLADCMSIFKVGDQKYVTSLEGIYKYGESKKEIGLGISPRFTVPTNKQNQFLCPNFYHGLRIFEYNKGKFTVKPVEGIDRLVQQIIPMGGNSNKFAVKTIDDLYYEVTVNQHELSAQVTKKVTLPDNTYLLKADQEILFINVTGTYRMKEDILSKTRATLPFKNQPNKIIKVIEVQNGYFVCYEDQRENIYCEKLNVKEKQIHFLEGSFFYTPFLPTAIMEDQLNKEIWISGNPGILVFKAAKKKQQDIIPETRIRQVEINNDSIITSILPLKYSFKHNHNDVKISFVSTASLNAGKALYQFKLGNDKWSEWTEETYTIFSGLDAGDHHFQVRSSSPYFGITKPDSFKFVIAKPWYNTIWAYLICFLITVLFIYTLYRVRVRSLINKQKELSERVLQTTAQLAKANASLMLKAEKLEELGMFKSKFFANVLHDLRTPLTLLKGRLHQLRNDQDTYLSEKGTVIFNNLEKDNAQLASFAEEISQLIALEEGKFQLIFQKVEINKYFRTIVQLFSSFAEMKQITLLFETALQDDEIAHFDPEYMQKVVYNLLSNAFKFTKAAGNVTVAINHFKEGFNVSFIDTGIGISQENKEKIFKRYFQVKNTDHGKEGFGIGLSLAMEIISLHNGAIQLNSEQDEGSTFACYIPFNRDYMTIEKDLSYDYINAGNEKLIDNQKRLFESEKAPLNILSSEKVTTVLIVDDHNEIRSYLRQTIVDTHGVLEAKDGKQALDMLKKHHVDAIITDLMMPWMNGFELIDALKSDERFSKIPIMVVSARINEADKGLILGKGVNNYLSKPFNPDELKLRLRNLIEGREGVGNFLFDDELTLKQSSIEKLNKFLLQNLKKSKVTAGELAAELHTSERNLYRMIKELTGMTPLEYYKEIKFNYAKELLKNKRGITVKEVAEAIGINNTTYFKKQFEERFGEKPENLFS